MYGFLQLSCCADCGYGCSGGSATASWNTWMTAGIVSGGVYGSHQGCQPYEIPPCEHYEINGTRPKCDDLKPNILHCKNTCVKGYPIPYKNDVTFGHHAYSYETVEDIQKDIMINGPISTAFNIYADFFSYKSGVYKYKEGWALGGHVAKMMGWGVENGVPYWLLANSWNYDWGINGTFKFFRGNDHCGIEDGAVAGMPV